MTTTHSPIRVAIVEDQSEVRDYLRAVVTGTPGMTCVGDFASARAFLQAERQIDPNLVLLDLEMPGMNGIDCVLELRSRGRKVEILVLTIHDDPEFVFPALAAGATGYLIKPVAPAALIQAIQDLHAGGAPMSGPIARRVLAHFRDHHARNANTEPLTKRECDVMEELARGARYEEIAGQLGVKRSSVHSHLHRIYEKLHVHNAAAAVARYLEKKGGA